MSKATIQNNISNIATAQIAETSMWAVIGSSFLGATKLPMWTSVAFGVFLMLKVAWGYFNVAKISGKDDRLYRYL